MYEKLNGIVLNTVKYSDRNNIVHVYTDEHGLLSFAVPQGNTRGARMRNAMLMPLSLIEMEARMVPGRDLATMHDLRCKQPLMSTHGDPVKNAIAMFMSEVLVHVIQERERNEALYTYIYNSVEILEHAQRGVANFHICFLIHLGALLGIEPDTATHRDGYWFNMTEGTFVPSAVGLGRYLPPHHAAVIVLLQRMRFDNLHLFKFNRDQRNEVLTIILDYYKLHNSTLGTLRSPEVLKQLFV
ncbi:MAG: DNA repair protein RecO [Muribaculaceae bacterium]|nr:DNA repair protein RecO [Muribaculaceae bacterium]